MNGEARPVGGPIVTWHFKVLLVLFGLGVSMIVFRFFFGLGATTALNDGFPWGIWIAYDVVVGTALACGGYAIAILCYVLNRGEYHPLVRPAILTSALGYSMAAFSVVVDVGRYWTLPKVVFYPWNWNLSSILLEVALCVMAYVVVLWIELFPVQLEKWEESDRPRLRRVSERISPVLDKALIWIVALGLLLPTMHQSSLGSLMLLAGRKLHGFWQTPWLPALFLISSIAMGYAVVVFESTICRVELRQPRETRMLRSLAQAMVVLVGLYLALRFFDLSLRDQFGALFTQGWMSFFFWLENGLFAAAAAMLSRDEVRRDEGKLLLAAAFLLLAGSLFRFDTYLIGFDPGEGWSYFPSVPELLITFGLVSLEVMAYIVIVKRYPILSGVRPRRAARAPAAEGGA
jgi:Ni/Fe-hydrogenase subunit HybB-like protein